MAVTTDLGLWIGLQFGLQFLRGQFARHNVIKHHFLQLLFVLRLHQIADVIVRLLGKGLVRRRKNCERTWALQHLFQTGGFNGRN